jgi:hypothetical protein
VGRRGGRRRWDGRRPRAAAWEGAIDIVALGLEEKDAEAVAATSEGSRERGKALKAAARKVEAMLKDVLKQRGVTESIRYDPKLKEKGLLDLLAAKGNSNPPATPKPKRKTKSGPVGSK